MNTKLAQASLVVLVLLSSILGLAEIAHAQLTEHCTVSILNRTARVRTDGSWCQQSPPVSMAGPQTWFSS